jgi:ribosomal protein L11 methyltransferase
MNYHKIKFVLDPVLPAREILYADLDQLNFEAIMDTPDGVEAFIPEGQLNLDDLKVLMIHNLPEQKVKFTEEIVEQQNWNAAWESQFEPIIINDKCMIRAPFHETQDLEYEIIISPKMSFGTGHHETTFLICQRLFELEVEGKSVMDMGSGTGVLAIIAKKLGAGYTEGIDIENWAYHNSVENALLNNIPNIIFLEGDASLLGERKFDLFIANINRNILYEDMPKYIAAMNPGAIMLLSGFYSTDVELLKTRAKECGLNFVNSTSKNNWALIQLQKD